MKKSTEMTATSSSSSWDGHIVARILPTSFLADDILKRYQQLSPASMEHQIDPATLKIGTGPESYRADLSVSNSVVPPLPESKDLTLSLYLYDQTTFPPTLIQMKRNSAEKVEKTLQRLYLNIAKKLAHNKKNKTNQNRIPTSSTTKSSAPTAWEVDPIDGTLRSEMDVSNLSNAEFWHHCRQTSVALVLPRPSFAEGSSSCWHILIQSCPPTVAAIRTFEDFSADLYVGVPLLVEVDTLFANQCTIDWYVDGRMKSANCSIYIPDVDDIDKSLSILVTPSCEGHDGRGCEQAHAFLQKVQPRPDNGLLQLRQGHWTSRASHSRSIRVVTYNILADQNAFQSNTIPFYPYVPKEILQRQRRLQLILHELLSYHADIVCLQEVDELIFRTLLMPMMRQFNYGGYFSCKATDGTREGCALFWSLDVFCPVGLDQQNTIVLSELLPPAQDVSEDHDVSYTALASLLNQRPDLRHVLTDKLGHVAQVLPLKLRNGDSTIWVANTHLFYHPRASHIRLIQMYVLMKKLHQLQRAAGDGSDAQVLCGDFNSSLGNAAGKLAVDGKVPLNFRNLRMDLNTFDWECSRNYNPQSGFDMDFPELSINGPHLQSVFSEPPAFTHYIDGFIGTLDHILVSPKHLRCVGTAPMPTEEDVTIHTAMPGPLFPSDHVSLVCDLEVVNGKDGMQQA